MNSLSTQRAAAILVASALAFGGCRAAGPQRGNATQARQPFSRPNVLLITIDALRADHLGVYGYRRDTSRRIDAFASTATVFEQAFTYWPKTRGSFASMLTGRTASRSGYDARHPGIADFNPTLASVLQAAGYRTVAAVDNPNVARVHGYATGFDSYRETWEETDLPTEVDRTRAITTSGLQALAETNGDRPLFLWLHYVNPHGPYTPPPPYDTAFLDDAAAAGPRLPLVDGFHGGIRSEWAAAGHDRLGYYVAQYDGEIAAADAEVGRILDALNASPGRDRTVVVIASDHGESLGEHDYYFDHGENLFDACLRIPLLVRVPGASGGSRIADLATSLDILPTVLDAVKVSYPPDLSGQSLLPLIEGRSASGRERLFAQNDRSLTATLTPRFKLIALPVEGGSRFALYDRVSDPSETRDVRAGHPGALRDSRREIDTFLETADREFATTRRLREGAPTGEPRMSPEACEKLKALGYVAGRVDCET